MFPPAVTKRNQSNQSTAQRSGNDNKHYTSTPSSAKVPPHPIALSNMFAALENHDLLESERGANRANKASEVSVDITSPEQFPPLPRGASTIHHP